jgi:histidine ammonia-lyase
LLNGTQFSTSYACWCLIKAEDLLRVANLTAAISIDGFDCALSPFDERLHKIRPHQGQINVARKILEFLEGSEIAQNEKANVQDPYAFRCVPQVHGASWDAIMHVLSVVETEVNSVTDNPNIFPDDDVILSGGNFHAQPIALVLDYLAIALAELGSISERRLYQLISGQRGLPAFLITNPGLNSGMMILQYTAASIVSQNKQLCTPASVDSIVSSNGQEDHVSMAANAATKLYRVMLNLERLLAIEFIVAMQALDFRPLKSSALIQEIQAEYRQVVPHLTEDQGTQSGYSI